MDAGYQSRYSPMLSWLHQSLVYIFGVVVVQVHNTFFLSSAPKRNSRRSLSGIVFNECPVMNLTMGFLGLAAHPSSRPWCVTQAICSNFMSHGLDINLLVHRCQGLMPPVWFQATFSQLLLPVTNPPTHRCTTMHHQATNHQPPSAAHVAAACRVINHSCLLCCNCQHNAAPPSSQSCFPCRRAPRKGPCRTLAGSWYTPVHWVGGWVE